MFVTKIDISIACESAKISDAGDEDAEEAERPAAARRPRTSRRRRAGSRARSGSRPTRPWPGPPWRGPAAPPTAPTGRPGGCSTPCCGPSSSARSLRSVSARSIAASSSTLVRSGTRTAAPRARLVERAFLGRGRQARRRRRRRGRAARPRARRSPRGRPRLAGRARPRAGPAARRGSARAPPCTAVDCEPGTLKPPLERSSACRTAKGAAAISTAIQAPRTTRRRRRRTPSRRSIQVCMGSS